MLRAFRSKLSSWLMLAFLGFAVLAIVVTGFGTGGVGGLPSGGSDSSETLVEVGGEEIRSDRFEALLRNQLNQARQQNPQATMAMLLAAGGFERMLNSTVTQRALWAFGRGQGFIVSDRMIDHAVTSIAGFRNFAGQFDPNAMRQQLQAAGLTEQQMRQDIALSLMQDQLQLPIALSARMPESIVAQYASATLERRRGTVATIATERLIAGIAPTDQEVAAFYAQNRRRYTIPERRTVRFAILGRDQVAERARATDQEIAAFYRANQARFGGSESRTLQQVVLQDEAAARRLAAQVRGGTAFAEAAARADFSASDITLGAQTREQFANVSSPEVANAVFGAQQGAIVGPLRSELGWHVVRIEGITRSAGRTIEAARAEIATEIERRKIQEALADLVTRIDERVGNGETFDEVARAERLSVVETPPVTASGAAPGAQWQAPAELAQLLGSAFTIDADDPEPAVETLTPNERYAFVSVARVVPPTVPPLQEMRDRVRTDLIRQRAGERAQAIARRIVQRINSGTPARQAYAEAGAAVTIAPIDGRRVDIMQVGAQTPPQLQLLFGTRPGRAVPLAAPNGAGWFVVHVEQRIAGQATCPRGQEAAGAQEGCQAIRAVRRELDRTVGSEYADQFARGAQNSVETQRYDEAIARLRQRLQSGAAR
jgi:peptidyl-prolyl cis-trans isomerase D